MKEKLIIRRGESGFALPIARLTGSLKPHYHDELEVNLIRRGHASYLFGNQRVPLTVHSMIWLFPRQEHVLIDYSPDFSMWVLVFRQKLVKRETHSDERSILRSRDPGSIFCRKVSPRKADALEGVYQDIHCRADDHEYRNAALGYALLASWRAYQAAPESPPLSDVHPAVARAVRLLSETDEPIALEQLARKSSLSSARLSRLFKQQTGVSVTGFRQRQCLERFLRLYGNGERYSVIDAALEAGFGSYAQFHRVFCGAMGMNPAAYRRKMAGQIIGEAM